MERNVIERVDNDDEQTDADVTKQGEGKDVGKSITNLGEALVKMNDNKNDFAGDGDKNNEELKLNSNKIDKVKKDFVPIAKDEENNDNMQASQQTLKETLSITKINENENKSSAEDKYNNSETTKHEHNQHNNTSNTTSTPVSPEKISKVKVHFVAVGSAPIMKKTKFLISSKVSFSGLQQKLMKMLQLSSSDASNNNHLFLYIQQSFVPCPEDLIGDLNELFSVRGELIIHYSLQEAWG
jgi:ubiquitin-like protein ATG12